jgi:hypothetical protein
MMVEKIKMMRSGGSGSDRDGTERGRVEEKDGRGEWRNNRQIQAATPFPVAGERAGRVQENKPRH